MHAFSSIKRTFHSVNVLITDENDLRPMFTERTYRATIDNDAPAFSNVLQVAADDADEGINAQVCHFLVSKMKTSRSDPLHDTRAHGQLRTASTNRPIEHSEITFAIWQAAVDCTLCGSSFTH